MISQFDNLLRSKMMKIMKIMLIIQFQEFGNEEKVNKHKKLLDDLDEDLGHAKKK